MTTVLAVLGCVLFLGVLAYADSTRHSRKIERAFAGRRSLSDEEFFQAHFRSMGIEEDVPAKVRSILCEELNVDMRRLAPEDSFTGNLQFLFAFDSLADVAIVQSLEETFGIAISDDEAAAMHTVKDIVLIASSKVRAARCEVPNILG